MAAGLIAQLPDIDLQHVDPRRPQGRDATILECLLKRWDTILIENLQLSLRIGKRMRLPQKCQHGNAGSIKAIKDSGRA